MNIHLYLHDMRPRDNEKQKSIQVKAMEIVVSRGFDGLSMQELARAAGVSPATIYIYYRDKDDLIEKISVHAQENMIRETLNGFTPEMPFEKGLILQWRNRATYWMKNQIEARFLEMVRHNPVTSDAYNKNKIRFVYIMRSFVKNAIRNKEIRPIEPELFWSIAYAPLYQLLRYHTDGKGLHGKPFSLSKSLMKKAIDMTLQSFRTK